MAKPSKKSRNERRRSAELGQRRRPLFRAFAPRVFCIYGKGKAERDWRVIDVFANRCRDVSSRWPVLAGHCITWGRSTIAVGWDFAEQVLREQARRRVTRDEPLEVVGGRIRSLSRSREPSGFLPSGGGAAGYGSAGGGRYRPPDWGRPSRPGFRRQVSASEILAHECGHTWQASRLGPLYLPIGALFTWWREGAHWWNWFENQASETGLFGGIVEGTVHPMLRGGVRGT